MVLLPPGFTRTATLFPYTPLFRSKTAIAGEDANWGRAVMAVGKAGEPAERDQLAIRFGDTLVAENGLARSEEHTSELQSLMRTSYAVHCSQKEKYLTQSVLPFTFSRRGL